MPAYRRILLKLSGEALGGAREFGLDPDHASAIAAEVAEAARTGVQFGIVVGGGNFFRGSRDASAQLERETVDRMGMLATVINAVAFADLLSQHGLSAEAMSAVAMDPLVQRFDRRKAIKALEAGRSVVFGGGTGNPYFSTDTAASLRAVEIGADLLAKATQVDGVYDKDPNKHPDAVRYEKISYAETLENNLGVMDAAAVALCRENAMPVRVFKLAEPGAVGRLASGENIGTLMT